MVNELNEKTRLEYEQLKESLKNADERVIELTVIK